MHGNNAITSVIRDNVPAIESHPDFLNISTPVVNLPEAPVMKRQFTYAIAKPFLNKCLRMVLGSRPGYGEDKLHKKPIWWTLPRWETINGNKCRATRDELVLLIASMYKYYGSPIDPSNIELTNPSQNSEEADTSVSDLDSMSATQVPIFNGSDSGLPTVSRTQDPVSQDLFGTSASTLTTLSAHQDQLDVPSDTTELSGSDLTTLLPMDPNFNSPATHDENYVDTTERPLPVLGNYQFPATATSSSRTPIDQPIPPNTYIQHELIESPTTEQMSPVIPSRSQLDIPVERYTKFRRLDN